MKTYLSQENSTAMPAKKFKTVEDYELSLPEDKRDLFISVRETLRKAAPQAKEEISYNMPCFKQNKGLLWYAIYKDHVGMYPVTAAMKASFKELSTYVFGKGTLRFTLDKPLPLALIRKIMKVRMKEDQEAFALKRTAVKSKKKK